MPVDLGNPQFWVAVLQIIAIDIVLGGDNAVVIALACRRPGAARNLGIFWGVFGAIGLRIVLIFFACSARDPVLVVGAALLVWIGIRMLQPETEGGGSHAVDDSSTLLGAIKTIIVADAAMSLDNVIAIAGAAKGSIGLVVFGLVVSVPIIGSRGDEAHGPLSRRVCSGRICSAGSRGDMTVTDVAVKEWVQANAGPGMGGPACRRRLRGRYRQVARVPDGGKAAALANWAARFPSRRSHGPRPARSSLFNRILLPVDGSDSAAHAVEYVIALASPSRSRDDGHPPDERTTGGFGRRQPLHRKGIAGTLPSREERTALERARKILDDAGGNTAFTCWLASRGR